LRRDHQAVISCTTARGARISIPIEAELNLAMEAVQRIGARLKDAGRLIGRGARWGWTVWTRVFGNLLRSRHGLWVLSAEMLVLAMAILALSFGMRGQPVEPIPLVLGFFQALPVALLAVYLLPALACVGAGIAREAARTVLKRNAGGRLSAIRGHVK